MTCAGQPARPCRHRGEVVARERLEPQVEDPAVVGDGRARELQPGAHPAVVALERAQAGERLRDLVRPQHPAVRAQRRQARRRVQAAACGILQRGRQRERPAPQDVDVVPLGDRDHRPAERRGRLRAAHDVDDPPRIRRQEGGRLDARPLRERERRRDERASRRERGQGASARPQRAQDERPEDRAERERRHRAGRQHAQDAGRGDDRAEGDGERRARPSAQLGGQGAAEEEPEPRLEDEDGVPVEPARVERRERVDAVDVPGVEREMAREPEGHERRQAPPLAGREPAHGRPQCAETAQHEPLNDEAHDRVRVAAVVEEVPEGLRAEAGQHHVEVGQVRGHDAGHHEQPPHRSRRLARQRDPGERRAQQRVGDVVHRVSSGAACRRTRSAGPCGVPPRGCRAARRCRARDRRSRRGG